MSNVTPQFDEMINMDDSNVFNNQNFYDQNYYHKQMVDKFKSSNKDYQIHLRVKMKCEPDQ
jgi:hypothetical protein